MIEKAAQYLRAGLEQRQALIEHYNKYCLPQVNPKRKYRMSLKDNWCAMFVTVIANKCGLGANAFPYEVSCYYQSLIAKDRGQWFTDARDAQPNDLIFYSWNANGVLNHVGFVESVKGSDIRALEGNIKNTVGYRSIRANNSAIAGFVRTDYQERFSKANAEYERLRQLALRTIRGEFGNDVKRIRALGHDYVAVQQIVNQMLAG